MSCGHCLHPWVGPIHISLPPDQRLSTCCKCGALTSGCTNGTRGAGTTAVVAAPKSKGDGGASLGSEGLP